MKINDTEALGKLIRQRRKELGYTQAAMSEMTGLSASFLSNLENGKPTCEVGKAIRVVNLLGMDLDVSRRGQH